MKKLMSSILLGAVVLTATVTSFAAGHEPIKKNGVLRATETLIAEAKIGTLGEVGITQINGVDIEAIANTIAITDEDLKKLGEDHIVIGNSMELPSFEEFIKFMKENLKDINEEDKKALKKLYNEAADLEKAKKFDKAFKKWEAFDKILEKYFKDEKIIGTIAMDGQNLEEVVKDIAIIGSEELPNFDEFIKEMKEVLNDIDKTDLKTLRKLYNEATTLEKDKKFDEANKKWEAFDKILEKYFKNGEIISEYAIELNEDLGEEIVTDAIGFEVKETN
ncbi:MAG: hypothetical protein N4A64_01550 [Marinisporobacter sp.]|jgi:hypothetical protein|nr:hypothetical protein [Marinisporobacter sp.]